MFTRTIPALAAVSLFALTAALPTHANAQDVADLGPICTDRPTKANSTCTVPTGHWQVETDFANFTRTDEGDVRTETLIAPNPYVKYGLSDTMDLQVTWAPYVRTEVRDRALGTTDEVDGVGDVYVRLKARLGQGETWSWGLIPFVKIPTASDGIGNDAWEGGLAAPVNFAIGNGYLLTFGPEIDVLKDSDSDGRHVALINVVNVAKPLNDKITLVGELWSSVNFDPVDTVEQYSADVAATYLINPTVQLDVGANFGLNEATPDVQVYVGVSSRF